MMLLDFFLVLLYCIHNSPKCVMSCFKRVYPKWKNLSCMITKHSVITAGSVCVIIWAVMSLLRLYGVQKLLVSSLHTHTHTSQKSY